MVVEIPLYRFSHHRKIANLYKKWVRQLEGQIFTRHEFRYEATLARAEFNLIYYEQDMRKSKVMLMQKEKDFEKFITPQIIFPSSPNGVCYEREVLYEDWVLDCWHPLEKAIYPEYFARRELRKQQYLEMWNRMHSPPKPQF